MSTVRKVPLGGGGAEVLVVCTVGHETLIQNVSQNMMRTCAVKFDLVKALVYIDAIVKFDIIFLNYLL